MSYTKNTWVDQAGQVRYSETADGDYTILTPNYENVTQIGTPVNATNMNHIEDGIEGAYDYVDTQITTLLNALYPVGSIYIGTQANCPLETLGIGTWTLVAADRALQGSSSNHSAGATVAAALPTLTSDSKGSHSHTGNTLNATGTINRLVINEDKSISVSGVFEDSTIYNVSSSDGWGFEGDGDCKSASVKFALGNGAWSGQTSSAPNHTHNVTWSGHVGSTVQPNAYVVNIWRRTA